MTVSKDLLRFTDPRGRRGQDALRYQPRDGERRAPARSGDMIIQPSPIRLHAGCAEALEDGGTACGRCSWLLEIDTPEARRFDEQFQMPEVP